MQSSNRSILQISTERETGGLQVRKFAIRRSLNPTMTREDVDAGALQSIFTLSAIGVPPEEAFDPRLSRDSELEWIRSYWQEGSDWGLCLYTARSESELELFHTACALPYVSFTAVDEVGSIETSDPITGRALVPPGAVLFTVEGTLERTIAESPSGLPELDDLESLLEQLEGGEVIRGAAAGVRGVRAYVDNEEGRVIGTFLAPDEPSYLEIADSAQGSRVTVRRVVEVTPSEYLGR